MAAVVSIVICCAIALPAAALGTKYQEISDLSDEVDRLERVRAILQTTLPITKDFRSVILITARIGDLNKKLEELRHEVIGGKDPLIGTPAPLGNSNNLVKATGIGGAGTVDSLVVAGASETGNSGPYHAIRWTLAGGTVDLGTLVGPNGTSFAYGISSDGRVIAGESSAGLQTNPPPFPTYQASHAFRWTEATGMTDLGTLTGLATSYSTAFGVNGDGSVIVGRSDILGTFNQQAFRWDLTNASTGAGTMTALGALAPLASSSAYAVSKDGLVAVGNSAIDTTPSAYHAVRWVKGQPIQDLGALAGHLSATATAVSGDGSVVVGTSSPSLFGANQFGPNGLVVGSDARAFRWTSATGMKDLTGLMTSAGVNMTGITLRTADTITSDGQFIGGSAVFPTTPAGSTSGYLLRYCDATVQIACDSLQAIIDGSGGSGPPIAGFTSYTSLQESFDALSGRRLNAGIQQHGIANMLIGQATPIAAPGSASVFGAVGSITGGGNARLPLLEGMTLLGGVSMGQQSYRDTKIKDAVTGAVALRYQTPMAIWTMQPFAEIGGFFTNGDGQFKRHYVNGAGSALGVSGTDMTTGYGYGRLGLAMNPTPDHELAVSVEGGRQIATYDRSAEAFGSTNPFNATLRDGTASMNVGKVKAQWTWRFADGFDATIAGAIAQSYDSHAGTTAIVPVAGTFIAGAREVTWYEYGARIGMRLDERSSLDVFVSGVAGDRRITTSAHVGAGYRYRF